MVKMERFTLTRAWGDDYEKRWNGTGGVGVLPEVCSCSHPVFRGEYHWQDVYVYAICDY